jgi:hypothetical protein
MLAIGAFWLNMGFDYYFCGFNGDVTMQSPAGVSVAAAVKYRFMWQRPLLP